MHECEKTISANKIKHLEDLKEKHSTDLNDNNIKFETAMKQLNKKCDNEKLKLQISTESQIKLLENKHKNEINNLNIKLEQITNLQIEKSS